MKVFSSAQFEELVTVTMQAVCREVELDDRQFDVCVATVAETVKKCLQAQGYVLPWIRNIRKN
jgi:hypothetical protein